MTEQIVLHLTITIPIAEYDSLMSQLVTVGKSIPEPDAVSSTELKSYSMMGDVKSEDADAKLEALKLYNSFLPPQLALPILLDKNVSFKQAATFEVEAQKVIDKIWQNGTLSGVDLLKMLTAVETFANAQAAVGNSDAIKYLNVLEKIKADRKKIIAASKPPKAPKAPKPPKVPKA